MSQTCYDGQKKIKNHDFLHFQRQTNSEGRSWKEVRASNENGSLASWEHRRGAVRMGGVRSYQPSALGSSGQRSFKRRKVRIKKSLRQRVKPQSKTQRGGWILFKSVKWKKSNGTKTQSRATLVQETLSKPSCSGGGQWEESECLHTFQQLRTDIHKLHLLPQVSLVQLPNAGDEGVFLRDAAGDPPVNLLKVKVEFRILLEGRESSWGERRVFIVRV